MGTPSGWLPLIRMETSRTSSFLLSMCARAARVSLRAVTDTKVLANDADRLVDSWDVIGNAAPEADVPTAAVMCVGLGPSSMQASSLRTEGGGSEAGESPLNEDTDGGEEEEKGGGLFSSISSVRSVTISSRGRLLLRTSTGVMMWSGAGGVMVGARGTDDPPVNASLRPTFLMGCATNADGGGSAAIAG